MGPISTVVITGGMVMLLIFFIPYINIGVAFCVNWLIYAMNFIVSWIENLPLSIVKGLYINNVEFACLLIALLLLMLVIEHKKKRLFFGMLSMLLIFSVSQLTRAVMQRRQMSMTVYSINKNTAIDFVCGNEHLMLCDTVLENDPSLLSFSVENNLVREGVFSNGTILSVNSAEFENMYLKKKTNIISFGGKTIGIFDKQSSFGVKMPYRPHLDYYLVIGKQNVDIERLLNCYVIDLLIIDGSVPYYLSQKIIKKAQESGLAYHDVKSDGAFVVSL